MARIISSVIPLYNEQDNVEPLYEELKKSFENLKNQKIVEDYEMIFVNDGSSDNTQKNLVKISKKDKRLKIVELRKNFGQTAGLKAGFDVAKGDLIVTMDGDLQNDSSDIKSLIIKLDEGYDVVSGWRKNRKDKSGKKYASKIMNFLRKKMIGDDLHDYGCSLKLYKKECIKDLQLFGELHRYITAYLHIKGYKIGEVEVNHRPRKSGKTKYKFNRGLNGILDLVYLKFWSNFSTRPLHFFGRLGIYQWIISIIIIVEQVIKALIIKQLNFGPLMALSSMLAITGLLTILFGFLFEIIMRMYFKKEDIYSVKRIIS